MARILRIDANRLVSWLVLLTGAALATLALQEYMAQWVGTGSFLGRYSLKLAVILALAAASGLLSLAGLALSLTPLWERLLGALERAAGFLRRLGIFLPVLAGLSAVGLAALLLIDPVNKVLFSGPYARLWVAWLLGLAALFLMKAWRPGWPPAALLSGAWLAFGLVFLLANQRGALSASPFTLEWSEGSRYYNASLWFSRQVYGATLPLPELHPTRYLLQSLAFLLPGASIAFHRAWQVFLWLFTNGLTAWALARRLKIPAKLPAALFGAWAFLTFFQGPVYYHLILCAWLVLLGFDRRHFWRSLGVVAAASIWAGISRINWYPVPAALAAALYLLEEPLGGRKWWRYLFPPAAWAAAGLLCAYAANMAYVALSGNPPEVFGSALQSPLLWYRLKPNPTFGAGVLLASLAFLPVGLAAAWRVLRGPRAWHALRAVRWLGLLAELAVFYGGGLLVSLKVGGGSNLHNLDNFIVLLAVIAGYLFFDRFAPEEEGTREFVDAEARRENLAGRIPGWALLLIVAIPVASAAFDLQVGPRSQPKMSEAQALGWLQGLIDQYAADGRPVLFISERQLVTYGKIKAPAFEPSYEKVFLMEMAMSRNPTYLGRYVNDLKQRKFSLIISEPMNARIQADTSFAEENNLWVEGVEIPTLGRYELVDKLDEQGYPIAVYAPKPKQ